MRGRSERTSTRATSMAWRTPFPPSRMPASIELSIKLVVCLFNAAQGFRTPFASPVGELLGGWDRPGPPLKVLSAGEAPASGAYISEPRCTKYCLNMSKYVLFIIGLNMSK